MKRAVRIVSFRRVGSCCGEGVTGLPAPLLISCREPRMFDIPDDARNFERDRKCRWVTRQCPGQNSSAAHTVPPPAVTDHVTRTHPAAYARTA
ncbi:hypothetical protein GCM10010250_16560 [Streptomyces althioticus]|nr:hypothetical protein GCM10010250_16560 [Streptomyces althioticus]